MGDKKVNYKMVRSTKLELDALGCDVGHLLKERTDMLKKLEELRHFKNIFDDIISRTSPMKVANGEVGVLVKDIMELHKYTRNI